MYSERELTQKQAALILKDIDSKLCQLRSNPRFSNYEKRLTLAVDVNLSDAHIALMTFAELLETCNFLN